MSGQDESAEKSHEPTPQKLLEARRKGEVAKSNDLLTAAGYAGLLSALLLLGEGAIRQLGTRLMVLIDQAGDLAPLMTTDAPHPLFGGFVSDVTVSLAPIFALPAVAVFVAAVAQRAVVFAPSKLEPKLSRISPVANAKNKFGRGGLFEFGKSVVKLLIYGTVLTIFIYARLPQILGSVHGSAETALLLMTELCVAFLFVVVLISASIGGIDAVWQQMEHLRKNRMSRKEITDETKESEGDPHFKQARRQRAMDISRNQMMADVPTADVVIVNPTHYAVALKWSRAAGDAPVCVAKGVDAVAASIRKIAAESGVPIHSDPPTARALHTTTEIGDQIAPDHYRAVAAAIRFAEDMRRRARSWT